MKDKTNIQIECNSFSNALGTQLERVKIIVRQPEKRPEYIEIDARPETSEPIIRFSFGDNSQWSGTMAQLKYMILLI